MAVNAAEFNRNYRALPADLAGQGAAAGMAAAAGLAFGGKLGHIALAAGMGRR